MLDSLLKGLKSIKTEDELELRRKNDQYLVDRAITSLQKWSARCITVCIVILAVGFIIIFGKFVYHLAIDNRIDETTKEILSNILDWTMKIVIGWLAKSFFEKNKI